MLNLDTPYSLIDTPDALAQAEQQFKQLSQPQLQQLYYTTRRAAAQARAARDLDALFDYVRAAKLMQRLAAEAGWPLQRQPVVRQS